MGDVDVTNCFHQWSLSERTHNLLAVQTPCGLVSPKFLPEGISPAMGYMQMRMTQIFVDFSEWMIVIFDNLLVLGHNEADFVLKFKIFLKRCEKNNLISSIQRLGSVVNRLNFSAIKSSSVPTSLMRRGRRQS
jgi:hypothetical protein